MKSGTLCSQIPENPEVLESLVFKEVPADVEYAKRKRIDSCQTEQHKSKFKRQDSHNAVGNKWKIKSRSTHRHVGPTLSLVKVNNNDQRRWHRQNYCHWTSTNWHKLHCGTGSNVALLRPTELLRRQWLDHCEGFDHSFDQENSIPHSPKLKSTRPLRETCLHYIQCHHRHIQSTSRFVRIQTCSMQAIRSCVVATVRRDLMERSHRPNVPARKERLPDGDVSCCWHTWCSQLLLPSSV